MLAVDGRYLLARPRIDDRSALIVAGVSFERVATGDDDHAHEEQHRRRHDLALLLRLQLKASEAEAEAGGKQHADAEPSVHARLHGYFYGASFAGEPQRTSAGREEQCVSRGFRDTRDAKSDGVAPA